MTNTLGAPEREGAVVVVSPHGRRVWRHFWCGLNRDEVEVEFEERGVPGFRAAHVVRCSAFDPPTAVACARSCVDGTFRRRWPPSLPVLGARS